ncbi:hypothetical protein [Vagococcus sp.]|uniref:hypothetical protein n=1 Tax=Vagococcus sp. TaxID=1933889 RepID=UPI003F9B43D4
MKGIKKICVEFLRKFKTSKNPEDNSVALGFGLLYVMLAVVFTQLFLPDFKEIKQVFKVLEVIKSSMLGNLSSFFITFLYILVTAFLVTLLSKNIRFNKLNEKIVGENKRVQYNIYNVICDTYYWINKICDLLLSILIPFLISLYFFENSNGEKMVETVASLITIGLMPTLISIKVYEFSRVIFIGLFEILKTIIYLVLDLFITLYILLLMIKDKINN